MPFWKKQTGGRYVQQEGTTKENNPYGLMESATDPNPADVTPKSSPESKAYFEQQDLFRQQAQRNTEQTNNKLRDSLGATPPAPGPAPAPTPAPAPAPAPAPSGGGAPPVAPSMKALASGMGASPASAMQPITMAPPAATAAPDSLRPLLGQRIFPQYSASLAALQRRLY